MVCDRFADVLKIYAKKVFFQKVSCPKSDKGKNIVLVHGLTVNSKVLDIQYKGYSVARFYASEGYTTWLIDISGHGFSENWEDPFAITTKVAAEDIIAAAEKINEVQGTTCIDAMGYSWGTMIVSKAQLMRPELIRKLVLMSPPTKNNLPVFPKDMILSMPYSPAEYLGVARLFPIKDCPGGMIPPEDFEFDEARVENGMVNKAIHDYTRYVFSKGRPNGPTLEIFTGDFNEEECIPATDLTVPAFVAYGDDDMYNNPEDMKKMIAKLPKGSASKLIPGGTHGIHFEKNAAALHLTILEWLDAAL